MPGVGRVCQRLQVAWRVGEGLHTEGCAPRLYVGALKMTSRDGMDLYQVSVGGPQITKNGQPYQLDWNFGDVGYVYFKDVGIGVWVASISAPQPVPSTPNRIDVYAL